MAKSGGLQENINHFAGVRLRVNGTGNLHITYESLDEILTKDLQPIVMVQNNRKEPLRLGIFVTQKSRIVLKTTDFDDVMRVNKLIVFLKPLYGEFPNGTDS